MSASHAKTWHYCSLKELHKWITLADKFVSSTYFTMQWWCNHACACTVGCEWCTDEKEHVLFEDQLKKVKSSEGIMRNCSLTAPYIFELMILYMSVMQALTSLHFRVPLEHNCMCIQLYLPELRPASYIDIAQKLHNNLLQFWHSCLAVLLLLISIQASCQRAPMLVVAGNTAGAHTLRHT